MHYYLKQNVFEYEEIKKLLSVKPKKELIECVVTKGIIEQEYAIDYDVNYYRANYRRFERVQEIDYIKFKTFLVKESSDYTIDNEVIKCFELVNDEKVEYCSIIEDQKVEYCKLIEEQNDEIIESCKLIEDQKVEKIQCKAIIEDQKVEKFINKLVKEEIINDGHQLIKEMIASCELIEDQEDINKLIEYFELTKEETIENKKIEIIEDNKVEDIRMPKSSRRLVLPKKILKVIAKERGAKNYENLSKSRVIDEINKLEPVKKKKKKIKFEKYKGDDLELRGKDIRKIFRLKNEKTGYYWEKKRY